MKMISLVCATERTSYRGADIRFSGKRDSYININSNININVTSTAALIERESGAIVQTIPTT